MFPLLVLQNVATPCALRTAAVLRCCRARALRRWHLRAAPPHARSPPVPLHQHGSDAHGCAAHCLVGLHCAHLHAMFLHTHLLWVAFTVTFYHYLAHTCLPVPPNQAQFNLIHTISMAIHYHLTLLLHCTRLYTCAFHQQLRFQQATPTYWFCARFILLRSPHGNTICAGCWLHIPLVHRTFLRFAGVHARFTFTTPRCTVPARALHHRCRLRYSSSVATFSLLRARTRLNMPPPLRLVLVRTDGP